MKVKKVLILTVTSGNGHNSCAQTLASILTAKGAEVKIIDYLKAFSTKRIAWLTDKGYNITAAHFLKIYNAQYRKMERRKLQLRFKKCYMQNVALSGILPLFDEIYAFRPDVIYCTNIYPAMALTDLRMAAAIPPKVYVSVLDYSVNMGYESCIGVDYINLPLADLSDECLRLGYRKEQILHFGIPIRPQFYVPKEKKEARNGLGMAQDLFTVMVMFGGGQWNGGYKLLRQVIRALRGVPAQIVMINGHNKREKEKIDKKLKQGAFKEHKIVNVGFTNEVEQYMSASDVVVSKLGGLSTTECISRLLPIVAAEKLLVANEVENADYLCKHGAALTYRNKKELEACLTKLRENANLYESMRTAQAALRNNGTEDLAAHILSQPYAEYPSAAPCTANLRKEILKEMKKIRKKEQAELKQKRK